MINMFQATAFLKYLTASRTVHSIHSPFIFDFIQNVLRDKRTFYSYDEIEKLREQLLLFEEKIHLHDLGAGSKVSESPARTIRSIAKHASTPARLAQLLFRTGLHYECKTVLELGTSLGLTTLYLSSISQEAKVFTIEGDQTLAALAEKNFRSLKKNNIVLLCGSFEKELPVALKQAGKVDLAYIDGNHRHEPAINYFNQVLPYTHEKSVIVIGDIHWSGEMQNAWKEIIKSTSVTATIDLFYLGIIFFRRELSKQNFVIRW